MTTSVTSKMTKDELVNVLIILMDIPKAAESGFRTSVTKLPHAILVTMYDAWVKANNKCELAKREAQFAKEREKVTDSRNYTLERDLARATRKLKERKV